MKQVTIGGQAWLPEGSSAASAATGLSLLHLWGLQLWGRAGGRAWVLPYPHPGPVCPGSGAEPSTANSSPTWKNTGRSRDCGSRTPTRTRPSAASCSSGPGRPARAQQGSRHGPPSALCSQPPGTPAPHPPRGCFLSLLPPSVHPAGVCVCVHAHVCMCVHRCLVQPSFCLGPRVCLSVPSSPHCPSEA